MPPDRRLELADGVLRVDLTAGVVAADFERLYDGILQEIRTVHEVIVDVRGAQVSNTGNFLLGSLVAQLQARDVAVTVLRDPAED
jgi:hypothetical protein